MGLRSTAIFAIGVVFLAAAAVQTVRCRRVTEETQCFARAATPTFKNLKDIVG